MANQYQQEISRLEQLLNSATKAVSADGLRTDFDIDQARRRLAELRRLAGTTTAKPILSTLNIGGAW